MGLAPDQFKVGRKVRALREAGTGSLKDALGIGKAPGIGIEAGQVLDALKEIRVKLQLPLPLRSGLIQFSKSPISAGFFVVDQDIVRGQGLQPAEGFQGRRRLA